MFDERQRTRLLYLFMLAICFSCGCINPPSNLVKTIDDGSFCGIRWTDNSNNEEGFNIYIGGSCANCNGTTTWTKVASMNKAAYNWSKSCCQVGECTCVMVKAYNANEESVASNILMLSPVC